MAQRILVIDDEADLLELVRVNLRQAGFEVELAATGSEAMERLRRSPASSGERNVWSALGSIRRPWLSR